MKTKKPTTSMRKAALALLSAHGFDGGAGGEGWYFAGRFESACDDLVDAGLCERHPNGLIIFSSTKATLTSSGSAVGKQVYRLTAKGKEQAERVKSGGELLIGGGA